jgi:hypothetical protein
MFDASLCPADALQQMADLDRQLVEKPKFLDRLKAIFTSGLIHSDDSQIGRSSSTSL